MTKMQEPSQKLREATNMTSGLELELDLMWISWHLQKLLKISIPSSIV